MNIKKIYGLSNQPSKFNDLRYAKSYCNGSEIPSSIVLGHDNQFWVCHGRDIKRLINLGFELAK